jgi:hypothetical protein
MAALRRGRGVYNIAEDDPAAVAQWLPALARMIGAEPPRRVPLWLRWLLGGDSLVRMMTAVRGSDNQKASRELEWSPLYSSWRRGFADDPAIESLASMRARLVAPSWSSCGDTSRGSWPRGTSLVAAPAAVVGGNRPRRSPESRQRRARAYVVAHGNTAGAGSTRQSAVGSTLSTAARGNQPQWQVPSSSRPRGLAEEGLRCVLPRCRLLAVASR